MTSASTAAPMIFDRIWYAFRTVAGASPNPRNLGGESFGVILVEAMAAGAAIVASDLDAFRRVLGDGAAGVLVRRGDAGAGNGSVCAAQ
jgi:glycosyltransferase involved in cell wall biosynthesis